MFNKVFIESSLKDSPRTHNILAKIKYKSVHLIDKYDDVWGKAKKPYLQKRENLNLFIANKKGTLVKEAPQAYGHGSEKHFYFIHSYNCIYECEYCYLQGYFNSPDLVFFINHEEIIKEMETIVQTYPDAWFHAGEFSDSLALSHITDEYSEYYQFFKKYPQAKLELRTKSINTKEIEKLPPLNNITVSFTLSSFKAGKSFDQKCPSMKHRLLAIEKLVHKGFKIGLHFDPIIYHDGFLEEYHDIITQVGLIIPDQQLSYISLGVVRFTKDVYREVESNYPESLITSQPYIKSFDGKLRYNTPMRMWILNSVKEKFLTLTRFKQEKIYLCMED